MQSFYVDFVKFIQALIVYDMHACSNVRLDISPFSNINVIRILNPQQVLIEQNEMNFIELKELM